MGRWHISWHRGSPAKASDSDLRWTHEHGQTTHRQPGWLHAQMHMHDQKHHPKRGRGTRVAQRLAQLLSSTCSLPAPHATPRTNPNRSDGHNPMVSCTHDLLWAARKRGGHGCVGATAGHKGIALQQENSRSKPRRPEDTMERDRTPKRETRTQRQDKRWSGLRGSWGKRSAVCPCLGKPWAPRWST